MRWILAVSLLLLIKINQIRTEDNEITEQPDKLDKNLRKALLKALSDLETENDTNKVISGVQEAQTSSFTIITSDKPTSAKTIQPDTVTPYVITNASEYTTSIPKFIVSSKVAEKTSVTPPTTTTTTEESQAKVEDLQFVAAPLVAAFTVHQDELGIPKSVEPILKQPGQKTVTTKDLEEQRLRALQEIEKKKEEEKRKEDEMKWQAYLQKQEELRLKHEAETKQRFLEEQFRILQERQKQQDYYLRQQQLIYEQQRQKLLEDQKRTNANLIYNNYKQSISVQPAVTFQPQSDQYVDNALQLPTKTYQNFQKPQFVYQQQQQQQQLPTQNSLNYQSSFSNPISSNSQNFQPHGNRVFRHESGTGNFVNSDYNQIAQSNRFFRSNPYTYSITPSIQQDYHTNRYVRAPYVNNQLNNLLYYSGIGQGKEQEELNLISKVLAFNIRGDNYYAGSENVEQRLVPPRNYYIRS